jgi:RNA polymerase sigma-70 factor, ECF subfamily
MRRHNERLYRAARAIVRDESEAEDVMQQAYVNAYSHLRQFDGRSLFSTWLTRIAVHEALARARRRGRYMTMDPEDNFTVEFPVPAISTPDPERLAFSRELGALIEAAIERLPDGAREVFILRQVEGMDTAEVAEVLGVNAAVVKTRLSRARGAPA